MDPEELAPVLLEYAQDKIVVIDETGRYVYVNEASTTLLGYEPKLLVGNRALDYIHPDDRADASDWFDRVRDADGPSAETIRYRHRTRDGDWVWLESRLSALPDGTFDGYVVSSRDVTGQVTAERERRDAETRLHTIARTVGDVLWMFDGAWSELLFVNPAYEDVFGQPIAALRDDPDQFLEAVHPDDVPCVRAAMERLSAGETVNLEYRVNPATDYGHWVWVQGEPIVEDGEVVRIVGFARDITDRRRRERQLAVMDNLLRHNLRNDMSVIVGNAECIAREADEPTAERAEIIRRQGADLVASADKQREIIELLTGSPVPESIDLVEAVTNAVETVRERYPDATIDCSLPDAAPTRAIYEIELAVTELVENAARHDPSERPELTVSVDARPETVAVTIRDDGPPIPEVEFRVLTGDWEMTDIYHTSGLGLWLVYWIVDLSDGHVSFTRSETGGNAVTVLLPRATE